VHNYGAKMFSATMHGVIRNGIASPCFHGGSDVMKFKIVAVAGSIGVGRFWRATGRLRYRLSTAQRVTHR